MAVVSWLLRLTLLDLMHNLMLILNMLSEWNLSIYRGITVPTCLSWGSVFFFSEFTHLPYSHLPGSVARMCCWMWRKRRSQTAHVDNKRPQSDSLPLASPAWSRSHLSSPCPSKGSLLMSLRNTCYYTKSFWLLENRLLTKKTDLTPGKLRVLFCPADIRASHIA